MNDKLVFFDDCLQSMKETSRDFANQESMCDLEIEVVNFDDSIWTSKVSEALL
jgi:hypothetical protein